MISRRSVLKGAALSLGAPMINRGRFSLFAQSETEYAARTVDLVRRSTVIDRLGLLTLDYRKLLVWEGDPGRFRQADFVRLMDSVANSTNCWGFRLKSSRRLLSVKMRTRLRLVSWVLS